jgi:DNA-binding NarL/FixJ family response regulator
MKHEKISARPANRRPGSLGRHLTEGTKTMQAKQLPPCRRTKRKVLLVDDHPMMRQGLAQLINQQTDLMVCAQAGDATDAMKLIDLLKPDLAMVDISLGGKSGLELIKDLQALHPEVPGLVMSMHEETLYAERMLRAGARGYVMKQAGGETVLEAIRQVLSGKVYVSEKMSAKILDVFSGRRAHHSSSPIENLTDREFEVFQLIGEGCTPRQIAECLHISGKTVDVHRGHIKDKLLIKGSGELVQHAVRWVEAQDAEPARPTKSREGRVRPSP